MILDKKCKKCRSLSRKLFLKGDKCLSDKCPLTKKPYPPGKAKGKKKHSRTLSTYEQQLISKKEIKLAYGLTEKQLQRFYKEALKTKKSTPERLAQLLELKIDSVIFSLGLAKSKKEARQLINHGHFLLNNRRHTIPSTVLKVGDVITLRPQSKDQKLFKELLEKNKKTNIPQWIDFDPNSYKATIKALPDISQISYNFEAVIESFSR